MLRIRQLKGDCRGRSRIRHERLRLLVLAIMRESVVLRL